MPVYQDEEERKSDFFEGNLLFHPSHSVPHLWFTRWVNAGEVN